MCSRWQLLQSLKSLLSVVDPAGERGLGQTADSAMILKTHKTCLLTSQLNMVIKHLKVLSRFTNTNMYGEKRIKMHEFHVSIIQIFVTTSAANLKFHHSINNSYLPYLVSKGKRCINIFYQFFLFWLYFVYFTSCLSTVVKWPILLHTDTAHLHTHFCKGNAIFICCWCWLIIIIH